MSQKVQTIHIAGKPYLIRFTTLSAFILQKELGQTMDELTTKMSTMKMGLMEIQVLLLACLEGQRAKDPTAVRQHPWTMAAMSNLIDEEEDMLDFWSGVTPVVMDVFMSAFPNTIKRSGASTLKKAGDQPDPLPPAEPS